MISNDIYNTHELPLGHTGVVKSLIFRRKTVQVANNLKKKVFFIIVISVFLEKKEIHCST